MNKKIIVTGCFLAILLSVLFCGLSQKTSNSTAPGKTSKAPVAEVKPMPEEQLSVLKSRLEPIVKEKNYTTSIYVKPLTSGSQPLLINDRQMRAASLIKIFIMAEAFRQAKAGLVNMNEDFVITANAKVGGSGILQGLPTGTHKTLRDLVTLMITESDNTATNLVIDRLSMASINQLIRDLGLKNTILQRKMMDTDSIKKGRENYTSAADIAVLFEKLYQKALISKAENKEMLEILLKQTDNDKIPARLPVGIKVAHKTGELVGALHDAGIVYDGKQNYIVCIMTEDVTNPQNTVSDIANLSEIIYQTLHQ